MKVSLAWLQKYFETPLPPIEEVAEALTFHSCEIEEMTDTMLDVKVLPDRAAYALSHRGIALEISAALNIPLRYDPLRLPVPDFQTTDMLAVSVDDAFVRRHMGAIIRGVKVGESPAWLKEELEAVGQRSINSIVDATNAVMLNIGQPLHAFDLGKISKDGDVTRIHIRRAHEGEQVTVLSGDTYTLTPDTFVIADATSGKALDIAGLKGGLHSGVDENTTDLFISVGTYDGTLIRKTSQKLKLWTDASLRYQNRPSAELVAYGMRDVVKLITDVAGGELVGVVDVYPHKEEVVPVNVSLKDIEARLGIPYSPEQVEQVLHALGCTFALEGDTYIVTPSFERKDLSIKEDVIEEVGRLVGYENVPALPLPVPDHAPSSSVFQGIEHIKDVLLERGFVEISTQSFAKHGDLELANPLDQAKPWLRASLTENMREALSRAQLMAPRVLGPTPSVSLFELGSVFTEAGESFALCIGNRGAQEKTKPAVLLDVCAHLRDTVGLTLTPQEDGVAECLLSHATLNSLGEGYQVETVSQGMYKPFSTYPFALRDVAVWTPDGTLESEVANHIIASAGEYLQRIDLFDRFEKEGRISYAFRLVFESMERTLTDVDLDSAMERVTDALKNTPGFEVR
jgi:phenylalanyl-tRNA synthetase beta chain